MQRPASRWAVVGFMPAPVLPLELCMQAGSRGVALTQDMQIDDVEGPSLDAMVEDRIGLGSGRPKRRQKTHAA